MLPWSFVLNSWWHICGFTIVCFLAGIEPRLLYFVLFITIRGILGQASGGMDHLSRRKTSTHWFGALLLPSMIGRSAFSLFPRLLARLGTLLTKTNLRSWSTEKWSWINDRERSSRSCTTFKCRPWRTSFWSRCCIMLESARQAFKMHIDLNSCLKLTFRLIYLFSIGLILFLLKRWTRIREGQS